MKGFSEVTSIHLRGKKRQRTKTENEEGSGDEMTKKRTCSIAFEWMFTLFFELTEYEVKGNLYILFKLITNIIGILKERSGFS